MNLIICLDDQGGMTFFGKRQSMDSALRNKALELAGEERLWMDVYSAGQFAEYSDRIFVDEDYLQNAPQNAWCFAERIQPESVLSQVDKLAIFRWNRLYPSDKKFTIDLAQVGAKLSSREDFVGTSHPNITLEVYLL